MEPEIAQLPGRTVDYLFNHRLDSLTKEELIRIISWQVHEANEATDRHSHQMNMFHGSRRATG